MLPSAIVTTPPTEQAMPNVSRPPLTEAAATVIANDISRGDRRRTQASEVPLAFQQHGRAPVGAVSVASAVTGQPRKTAPRLAIFALAALAVFLVVRALA
jgi:hypothetical protein